MVTAPLVVKTSQAGPRKLQAGLGLGGKDLDRGREGIGLSEDAPGSWRLVLPPGRTVLFPAMQQTLVTRPAPAFIPFCCCFWHSDRFGHGLTLPEGSE